MVVIDAEGNNLGVLSKFDALNLAKEAELDLVLVSPNANPPVARIVDYSKLKYERSKKARKGQTKPIENKEWWFSPTIADRDLQIKLEKVKDFLSKGGNAKLTVKWKKRTLPEQIKGVMDKILVQSAEFAKPMSEVLREGRNLSILVKLK
ncbi:Translation initiation factor IF-3 [Patescibacteria group bacterium]|nr:Translation initiation factor IF-3 [Patescibacteria group bacterium]